MRSKLRAPRERVTECVFCGRPFAEVPDGLLTKRPSGGRIYCTPRCGELAAKARRAPLPKTDYAEAIRRDPCAYCSGTESICLDHIEPLNKGGANDELNLTAACKSCNSSKNDDRLLSFLWWRSGLNPA